MLTEKNRIYVCKDDTNIHDIFSTYFFVSIIVTSAET